MVALSVPLTIQQARILASLFCDEDIVTAGEVADALSLDIETAHRLCGELAAIGLLSEEHEH